jgi:hypothetical protein
MSQVFDGTQGKPLRVTGSTNERNLSRYEVVWVADSRSGARSLVEVSYLGLKLTSVLVASKNGAFEATGVYEGLDPEPGQAKPDAEDGGATYELDATHAQNPIQSHPKFDDLKKKFGWTQLEDGSTGFPKKLPDQNFSGWTGEPRAGGDSPMYGVTQWLDVGVVWRKTWAEEGGSSTDYIRNLGRIDSPEGPAPAASGGRNWLLTSVRERFRGRSVEITKEWTLSGRGGWQPEIYSASAK